MPRRSSWYTCRSTTASVYIRAFVHPYLLAQVFVQGGQPSPESLPKRAHEPRQHLAYDHLLRRLVVRSTANERHTRTWRRYTLISKRTELSNSGTANA